MSLYAEFVKETRGVHVTENEHGFISFSTTGDDCYIEDVYVSPDKRMEYVASELVNQVKSMARAQGCKTISTTVNGAITDPTSSLKACLAYGFKLVGAQNNIIILKMEI